MTAEGVTKSYEEGKDRRHKAPFAVNGGAFGIAKLLAGDQERPRPVAGSLGTRELAVGVVPFGNATVIDVDAFGRPLGVRAKR
jgi:hypothetical protein